MPGVKDIGPRRGEARTGKQEMAGQVRECCKSTAFFRTPVAKKRFTPRKEVGTVVAANLLVLAVRGWISSFSPGIVE